MNDPGLDAAQAAAAVLAALDEGGRAISVTRVDSSARRLVFVDDADGLRRVGSAGSEELDEALEGLSEEVLAGTRSQGRAEYLGVPFYLEAHQPRPDLVIVGAGHIALPLSAVGELLGFRVTVADDRPDFATRERFPDASHVVRVDFSDPLAAIPMGPLTHVVLVTRGHKYDYEVLLRLLRQSRPPRYIGMIGSRRRVRATFEQLVGEGIPRDRIALVRAPLGLDLGAQTPAEIAVAVGAELVLEWRGGTGSPLHARERVLERFFSADDGGRAKDDA